MATFAVTKTGYPGITAWEYYVENKDNWEKFCFECKTEGEKIPFKEHNGNVINELESGIPIRILSNQSKTFGGGSKGTRIHALVSINGIVGYIPIKNIRKPTKDMTAKENESLELLDKAIREKDKGNGINVIIKGSNDEIAYYFENCTGAKTVKGTPKADFSILVKDFIPVCNVSHKAAGGCLAYQQYVSITGNKPDPINSDPFIKEGLSKFGKYHNDIVQLRIRYRIPIEIGNSYDTLINRSIYGPEFGYEFSFENVHFIAQGIPILNETSFKNTYELVFSENLSINGDLEHFKKPGYQPMLFARYQTGRKFYSAGNTYKDTRVLLGPTALAPNARIAE